MPHDTGKSGSETLNPAPTEELGFEGKLETGEDPWIDCVALAAASVPDVRMGELELLILVE